MVYMVDGYDSPIVFGDLPNDLECWKLDFDVLMCECRYVGSGGKNPQINILHIGINFKSTMVEMTKILRFLECSSFTIEYKYKPKDWSDADILIIGSDVKNSKNAINMIKYLPSSLGIITSLDVLFYGVDGKIDTPELTYQPLHTNSLFGNDGVCMVHSYIRRLTDDITTRGIFVAISIDIENCIDIIMDKNSKSWNDKPLATKIDCFKNKIKHDGYLNNDVNVELFFSAMGIVRDCRNTSGHKQQQNEKERLKEYQRNEEFYKFARDCDRNDLCPPISKINDFNYMIQVKKYYVRLATLCYDWVNEYAKRHS